METVLPRTPRPRCAAWWRACALGVLWGLGVAGVGLMGVLIAAADHREHDRALALLHHAARATGRIESMRPGKGGTFVRYTYRVENRAFCGEGRLDRHLEPRPGSSIDIAYDPTHPELSVPLPLRTGRASMLIAIVIALGVAMFGAFGFHRVRRELRLWIHGIETTARIVWEPPEGDQPRPWRFSYEADGRTYTSAKRDESPLMLPGELVRIVYDPRNPTRATPVTVEMRVAFSR